MALAGAPFISYAIAPQDRGKTALGIIGVGLRGRSHAALCLDRSDVDIVAVCDIQEASLAACRRLFSDRGRKLPREYTGGIDAYQRMLRKEKLDAVIIATPWQFHYSQSIDAMKAGVYVGCEVIAGLTLEEHWSIVETSENTGIPYMCLENVDYRRDVLAVLNMVRQGIFGELVHLEGGYEHDLRTVLFNNGETYARGASYGEKGFGEAKWRTQFNIDLDGDIYPTHGFGPVMNFADINHGNRVVNVVSFSSKARGLADYIEGVAPGHPHAKIDFKCGDVTTSVMKCANGETIVITHDTHLPRPYSTGLKVQGTKGIWMELNNGIHLDSDRTHNWKEAGDLLAQYDHPLWKKHGQEAKDSGHGGADWFVVNDFLMAVRDKRQTPIDVYDSVTMSALFPLSIQSIKQANKTLEFPDFTRGGWKARKRSFALEA